MLEAPRLTLLSISIFYWHNLGGLFKFHVFKYNWHVDCFQICVSSSLLRPELLPICLTAFPASPLLCLWKITNPTLTSWSFPKSSTHRLRILANGKFILWVPQADGLEDIFDTPPPSLFHASHILGKFPQLPMQNSQHVTIPSATLLVEITTAFQVGYCNRRLMGFLAFVLATL